MAAGTRVKLVLIDLIMSGCGYHLNLDASELGNLAVICARPLAMAC